MLNEDISEVKGKVKAKIKDILENHEVPKLSDAVLKELGKWEQKFGQ